ncbi:MAG: 23S rRNA m(2)G-2445 methyltransferase [Magnetococcales bacterium]|nr:23S rRNA m(2)G-2445 methyltransferase [Magnetococcales bacterium]HIJ84603.1 bifunctional 23S rRNA (guanine(2069)-N(7))-methyltransferase RlmK/23S rRNA (guanine(2445)-N(2))-methyltransferase RlmL [Magnetococcales bacterium]
MNLVFFATSPQGTEPLLAKELKTLGAARIRPAQGGVSFEGSLTLACLVCLWSRIASRLLLPLERFVIETPEDLYAGATAIPWEDHLRLSDTFAVDFFGTGQGIRHTNFGGLRVKDAIADRFRNQTGSRPSVRLQRPEVRVHCRLRDKKVMIALDLSGESLHRRGYRLQSGEAPLKENLAAAILMLAGWPEMATDGKSFLDPMCGTGALAIEAALMAADGAPGLGRDYYGFTGWVPMSDPSLWNRCRQEAKERFQAGLKHLPQMVGLDADPKAVNAAKINAAQAGFHDRIRFDCQPLEHLGKESGQARPGLLVTNPPYGIRLGLADAATILHQRLGDLVRRHFFDWYCAIFSGLESPDQALGWVAQHKDELKNGSLSCHLLHYPPEKPNLAHATPEKDEGKPVEIEGFVNRLLKNKKRLDGWCRQSGISCYRLYDADLPEFAMAIDCYAASIHVQEYLPPKTIDPQKAGERLRRAVEVIPKILNVSPESVFLKTRMRGQGGARYGVFQRKDEFLEVREGDLRFLVNLEDRLDTGLFLDYRQVRALVKKHAYGRRFLNLFGYTGTATVYAAAGEAAATLTMDMSNLYLDWAKKNMRLNGFTGQNHQYLREDCVQWLENGGDRFDLILLDPPSFSNSKGIAKPLNLQSDHVDLIQHVARRLTSDGILLFSTNFQRFKLDESALQPTWNIQDLSRQTLPLDFARNPKIHRCWMLTLKQKNRV